MKPVSGISACVAGIMIAGAAIPASAQGVDYHKAQQAGKVWGDKISENNRQSAADRNARVNSEGVRYDAPLTASDRAAALAANRVEYQRLLNSVGKKNADRWLDFKARRDRAQR